MIPLPPQFYNYNYDDPNQEFVSEGDGVVSPWAYKFTNTTQWASTEQYTIIGLYRQNNAWGNVSENLYSFTPNTIFVPYSSVTSDMDYGNQAFFQTLVLHNGRAEQFRTLVDAAGYEGLFVYYDQDYTTISETLMNYRDVAKRAELVGIVVFGVILLLFLLLFPGSQGKTLSTMTALGAKRSQRVMQLFIRSVAILLPATLLGLLTSVLLWNRVVAALAESAGAAMILEIDLAMLVLICLAQLCLALILTGLLALPMTKNAGIRKRR